VALVEHAAVRVDDAPVQRRAENWLALDADRAQLAVRESALLLSGGDQALVGEVPSPKFQPSTEAATASPSTSGCRSVAG
jgi:hypothetical protein